MEKARKFNSILTSLKATKYIPSPYEVNVSGNGDTDIPKKNNHSVGHNKSNSVKRNAVSPDYHVQIESRSAKYKSGKYINYKLSTKFLSWTFIFLLASLLIVLIIGYFIPSQKYCFTAECVRAAAILRLSLNTSVSPCENFFQFTCGGWEKEFPLYPDSKANSKFSKINDRVFDAVSKFLSTENSHNDIDPVKQIRIYHKSCLDKDSRERMGFTVIYEYLEIVGLSKVPTILSTGQETELKFDWVQVESKIKRIFDMDVFIGFTVTPNRFNTLENLIYIGRPIGTCHFLRPLKRKKEDKSWKIIIKYIIGEFIQNATNDARPVEDQLEQAASIIDEMTVKVERFVIPKNYSEDDDEYHVRYSFQQLQNEIDTYTRENCNRTFPQFLKTLVKNIFEGTRNNATDLEKKPLYIKRKQKPYLLFILSYLLELPDIYIELYMWWSVVVCLVMNSSTKVQKFIFEQYRVPNSIRNSNKKPTAEICEIEALRYFSLVLAYGIANESFSTGSGSKIKLMVEELREAFTESVHQINWMDEKAKTAIMEKSGNINTFIGFPKWLFVKGKLEEYYKGLNMNLTSYLHNAMEIVRRFSINMFEEPITRNRTESLRSIPENPLIVNAFNAFTINSIIIPLAIVTFPLYDLGLEVLNYGSMGSILGHELIHGFDSIGWQFDKYGSYRHWLSLNLIKIFERKSICFKEQYENATVVGIKGRVSGDLTLSENIADNGGLRHALFAYRKFRSRFGREAKLPGFENFSDEQMFFIAFGSVWCQNISPELLERLLKSDPHSPNSIRVNMAVSNSEDFAEAFKCPKGSKMNPIKKCKIW